MDVDIAEANFLEISLIELSYTHIYIRIPLHSTLLLHLSEQRHPRGLETPTPEDPGYL